MAVFTHGHVLACLGQTYLHVRPRIVTASSTASALCQQPCRDRDVPSSPGVCTELWVSPGLPLTVLQGPPDIAGALTDCMEVSIQR